MNDVKPEDPQVNAPQVPAPVSNPVKEAEPLSMSSSPAEQEIKIPAEMADSGVESVSERVPLTEEHERVGISHSEKPIENTPIVQPASTSFKATPLTSQEVVVAEKKSIVDAIKWLANLFTRQLKRDQFNKQKTSPQQP